MEWLNFRHLYAFWMVARTGSFTNASNELHVAQSALSSQVASLESYCESELLVRSSRGVELTARGRELMGYANSIFAQSRAINELLQDPDALGQNRSLRVGVVGGASRNFVYRVLAHYHERSPGVHLAVSTGSYDELYEKLRRYELDSIITLDLPRKEDMTEVSYQKLGESRMCVVGTPDLIAAVRKRRKSDSFDVYKFRHPFEVDVLDRYVKPQLRCELELRMDTDDVPLLRFFANSGSGLAVIPRVGVLEDLEAGVVKAIELQSCPEVIIYGITMQRAHSWFEWSDLEWDSARI